MRILKVATFAFSLIYIPFVKAAEQSPFLSDIPLEIAEQKVAFSESSKLIFTYHSSNEEALLDLLSTPNHRISAKKTTENVEISLSREANLPGAPRKKHSESSFVIDIDEESTQAFISGFDQDKASNTPSLNQIEQYVNGYIESPTYIHGFLIASKVARDKSGDCTEYAVLTTSLARALGFPARYTTGVVIIKESEQVQSFGHAWTEIWHNNKWHIIDAAMHEVDKQYRYYLPVAELENEGPGFTLSLMHAVRYFPKKISHMKIQ